MVVPWKRENAMARDLPSDSVYWGKIWLLLNSPDDLSAFLTQCDRDRVLGCLLGRLPSSPSFFHIDGATSHMLELQSCRVFQCQLQSAPGPIQDLKAQSRCKNIVPTDGSLYGRKFGSPTMAYVYAILFLNGMLFFWTLSISWRRLCPLFAAQISVTSFLSQLSFNLVIFSYFHSFSGSLPNFLSVLPLWLCTIAKSMSKAKCCGTGVTVSSVLTNPSLNFSKTEIPAKIVMKPWDHMVLCLCIHLSVSTYFCLAGDCKLAGLLLILWFK